RPRGNDRVAASASFNLCFERANAPLLLRARWRAPRGGDRGWRYLKKLVPFVTTRQVRRMRGCHGPQWAARNNEVMRPGETPWASHLPVFGKPFRCERAAQAGDCTMNKFGKGFSAMLDGFIAVSTDELAQIDGGETSAS